MARTFTIVPILICVGCGAASQIPDRNAATAAEADATARAAFVRVEPAPAPTPSDDPGTEPTPAPARTHSAPSVSDTQRRLAAGLELPRSTEPIDPSTCRNVALTELHGRTYTVRQPGGNYTVEAEPVPGETKVMRVCLPLRRVSKVSP